MGGIEATSLLRAFEHAAAPSFSRELVIGMSADSDADTKKQAYAAGVDYFISKPFATGDALNLLSRSCVY
jgi:CheY-like chemotaxis protein